jgi:hypothetical protein
MVYFSISFSRFSSFMSISSPESTNRTGQRPLASQKEPMMTQRWPFKSVRETRLRAIATDLVWKERAVEGAFDAGMYHDSALQSPAP